MHGHHSAPWKNQNPILFSVEQCNTPIKTGMLVYFEIDNKIVTNIEQASIFNFDKELIESYVSVYSKVGWNEGNTSTYIRYQNISELKEPIPEEETNDFSQTLNEENNVSDTNINLSEIDEDFLEDLDEYVLDDDFLFEDNIVLNNF